jgi:UDP-glucuronate 4-epimerase
VSSDRTVLLTGGAGFIGSHVAEALLARGDRVVVVDNFDTFYDPAIKRRNIAKALGNANHLLVEGDIRDERTLARAWAHAPFHGVIHLAARAGVRPSIQEPMLYDDVNVRGTTMMLELARRFPSGHFVFGSSSSVYGSTSPIPFRESEPADRPSSPYASTKRANELACHAYHHIYGMDIACLRFFTVYGPRQRPEMAIHKFTRQIDNGEEVELYGDGSSQRDYTFVADIVDGVLRALDTPRGYRIYNLGTTATTPLARLAEMIAERVGRPLRVRHLPEQAGDVPITYADVSRARDELGYRPTTPIATGLTRFVEWYRALVSGKSEAEAA